MAVRQHTRTPAAPPRRCHRHAQTRIARRGPAAARHPHIGPSGQATKVAFKQRGMLMMDQVKPRFTALRLDRAADGPCNLEELQQAPRQAAAPSAVSRLYQKAGASPQDS